ncbi:MAG: type I restriction endonuclease, partial [Desulfobulbaceae bacterium]|nr:type I restriction endonuclease [Desulfobulbaceae bacterium]
MKFTEARLEQAIVELLGKEGYPHVLGETISREPGEVIIKEDLKKFLAGRYGDDKITPGEIDAIVRKLELLPASDLYESNKAVMKMVSDGFLFKRDDRSQKDLYIQLIDYHDLPQAAFAAGEAAQHHVMAAEASPPYLTSRNIYKMVNQLEITGYEKRIPDGILYINGLPLVVFEFKSAIREEATIHDAYVQLTVRYKRDIPELFKYNGFCVISDGV